MAIQDRAMITVFGGGGFIGRYVCEAILKSGARLRVAQRDPRQAFFLQPLGQVGQVGFTKADFAKPSSIERAVEGATGVVNLVGIFKGDLDRIHVEGARMAAAAARDAGTASFVHISAIGADPSAASVYGSTKGRGEEAVRAAFPNATIIRPSVVFGPEDEFTNRFASLARLPVLPVIAANRRFQPVYARDLGQAIAAAALDPQRHGGKTYELGGPQVLTMREINAHVAAMAGQSPNLADMPDFIAGGLAALGFLPGAPLSRDQWAMLQHDNVVADDASGFRSIRDRPDADGRGRSVLARQVRVGRAVRAESDTVGRGRRLMPILLLVIILGIVEGLTEYLPVSSTGHLILATELLGFDADAWALFNIAIQPGAILAIVVLYWRTFRDVLTGLWKREASAFRFTRNLLIAFVPAVGFGLLLGDQIELLLGNARIVAWALIVGGAAILVVEKLARPVESHGVANVTTRQSLVVGLVQCLAMVPGVSRSGATILGAMAMGVDRKTAAEFSFFLAVPTLTGATVLQLAKHHDQIAPGMTGNILIGAAVSFVVAVAVVKGFVAVIQRFGFAPFAWYRIVAGIAALVWLGAR